MCCKVCIGVRVIAIMRFWHAYLRHIRRQGQSPWVYSSWLISKIAYHAQGVSHFYFNVPLLYHHRCDIIMLVMLQYCYIISYLVESDLILENLMLIKDCWLLALLTPWRILNCRTKWTRNSHIRRCPEDHGHRRRIGAVVAHRPPLPRRCWDVRIGGHRRRREGMPHDN